MDCGQPRAGNGLGGEEFGQEEGDLSGSSMCQDPNQGCVVIRDRQGSASPAPMNHLPQAHQMGPELCSSHIQSCAQHPQAS